MIYKLQWNYKNSSVTITEKPPKRELFMLVPTYALLLANLTISRAMV
ncbi:hypothetical protein C1A50_2087 [Paenibacillus polymyxa]|nr:hypothetical protein C1A50_2087 [Paenibacillus polymyxa]